MCNQGDTYRKYNFAGIKVMFRVYRKTPKDMSCHVVIDI